MKVVQELVAYFDRRGRLSRRQLRRLLEQHSVASDAPANMHGLCETVGTTYYFRVTGVTEGQLWGTDIYSGPSQGDCGHATGKVSWHSQEWRHQHGIRALSVRLEAIEGLIGRGAILRDPYDHPLRIRVSAGELSLTAHRFI
jgi:hypothetical protein